MIKRSKRSENYTVIPNAIINDESLDWKSMGLLVYLLSKPDNWQVSIEHLANQKKAGKDAVKSILKALKSSGYIVVNRLSSGHVDWVVFDKPQVDNPLEEKPKAEKPHVEKPHVDNPTLVSTERAVKTERESKEEKINKKEICEDDNLSVSVLFNFKPEVVDEGLWLTFIKIRKKRKATQSARAIKAQLRELDLCEQGGISKTLAIERFLEESWKSLKFQWLCNSGGHHAGSSGFGKESASERNARISQETTRQHEETIAQALADGLI